MLLPMLGSNLKHVSMEIHVCKIHKEAKPIMNSKPQSIRGEGSKD